MSARRLEEFIGLIETAERVSSRGEGSSCYPRETPRQARSGHRGGWTY
jgi:hypothetical protein